MKECRAAIRWAVAAFVISVVSLVYATWYIPGLIKALNRMSDFLERRDVIFRMTPSEDPR